MIKALLAVALLSATPGDATAYPDTAAIRVELNRLRTDPGGYVASLRAYRANFAGGSSDYTDPRTGVIHVTREGAPAVDEAIAALTGQVPLGPLANDPTLTLSAADFVAEQGPTGRIGHRTADNLGPGDRAKRRGGDIYVAETISYGAPTAAEVVRQLIVDDGVAGRGHRRILLSPDYHVVGIACGPHARYGVMCVLDLSAWPAGRPGAG